MTPFQLSEVIKGLQGRRSVKRKLLKRLMGVHTVSEVEIANSLYAEDPYMKTLAQDIISIEAILVQFRDLRDEYCDTDDTDEQNGDEGEEETDSDE